MDTLNINQILGRDILIDQFTTILKTFEANKYNLMFKKGIYIYGPPGTGKTEFVINILKNILNYDVIKYDAGDFRNKSIVDTISKHNMSDKNIMNLFYRKVKPIAIVMDEIDGMNNGDKGGINTLIKLIRPKKTKKQKLEDFSINPIICIGNYHIDKKIKELIKVCNSIELKPPTHPQINTILKTLIPAQDEVIYKKMVHYVQGDLRKIKMIHNIYKNNEHIINSNTIDNIFQTKSYNDDIKPIITTLFNNQLTISDHNVIINETDRTIVGLLWHENIIDVLHNKPSNISIPFYLKQLNNICFSDYIDRITFQKQIWQFNEMTSLIKTFKNNKLYHETFNNPPNVKCENIRFTKVLTKYSTEYNNYIFIQYICQQIGMDKKDMISFFIDLKNKHTEAEIIAMFENYDINKLDIIRLYRYIDKQKKTAIENIDDDDSYQDEVIFGNDLI
jgi:DNA polymerase III delta prime subunit